MQTLNWYAWIQGGSITTKLPHATYQATRPVSPPDLLVFALDLKKNIEANVWTRALVLVVESINWAETAG